ncbi:MAG: cobyric acid synthase [Candidatus Omnitrophica bacterium]|nr:cobyric acid synthase [Candidatus Omnitrophota bacterium]
MPAKSLMILGTASGVGKSLVTAGFCRLLSDTGCRVAPFKAQNMSNNSWVTAEGGEMGRAQVVQAECARIEPHTDMNPVLLKPSTDQTSQVIVHGFSVGQFSAREYFSEGQRGLFEKAKESFNRLAEQNDFLVLEGAGSPAEVNLKSRDFVNMKTAEMADAVCVLVADIDRGGVFASVIGTLDLLEPHERARIKGIIINKFRGDVSLFDDGIKFIEERTGVKVLGILPYDHELWMMEEDSVPVENRGQVLNPVPNSLDIAVVYLPRISNFTDFEVLRFEPGVRVRYLRRAEEMGSPDLLILPGTKATIADLDYLKEKGFTGKILDYAKGGGRVLGICGGFQMLGETIRDGQHQESKTAECPGLGLFKMTTEFFPEKVLKQVESVIETKIFGRKIKAPVRAYEIHMGRTEFQEKYPEFGPQGIVHSSGKIAGTYLHGLFDETGFRHAFLQALAADCGKSFTPSSNAKSLEQIKQENYDRLAALLRKHLELEFLEKFLGCQFKVGSPGSVLSATIGRTDPSFGGKVQVL